MSLHIIVNRRGVQFDAPFIRLHTDARLYTPCQVKPRHACHAAPWSPDCHRSLWVRPQAQRVFQENWIHANGIRTLCTRGETDPRWLEQYVLPHHILKPSLIRACDVCGHHGPRLEPDSSTSGDWRCLCYYFLYCCYSKPITFHW